MTFEEFEETGGGKHIKKDTGCCTIAPVPKKDPSSHLGAVESETPYDWKANYSAYGFEVDLDGAYDEYGSYGPSGEVRLKPGYEHSFKIPRD